LIFTRFKTAGIDLGCYGFYFIRLIVFILKPVKIELSFVLVCGSYSALSKIFEAGTATNLKKNYSSNTIIIKIITITIFFTPG